MENQRIQVGPGFSGMLTIVFITLKLIGIINWSWLWVLSPLWLPLILILGMLILIIIFLTVYKFFNEKGFLKLKKKIQDEELLRLYKSS